MSYYLFFQSDMFKRTTRRNRMMTTDESKKVAWCLSVLIATLSLFPISGCEPAIKHRPYRSTERKLPYLEVEHKKITWRFYDHDLTLQPMCPKCGVEGYIIYPEDDSIKCSFGCQACDWSSREFKIDGDVLMALLQIKIDNCGFRGFE